jgi:hypothetical protein
MGTPLPITEEESLNPVANEAWSQAREVLNTWVRDQIGVRDAEIRWMGRRRQLLTHEKLQIRKCQTRAYNRCMRVLRTHQGVNIIAITPDLLMWKGSDGGGHQEVRVDLNLEEGPDPLQYSLEDWIDEEKQ